MGMHSVSILRTLLSSLCLLTVCGVPTAWSYSDKTPATPRPVPPLQSLKSFEVILGHDSYDIETQHVDAELYEYVRTALQHHPLLKTASPAEGVLHLSCGGPACAVLTATVTAGGPDGPEVWRQRESNYWFYDWQKDPRRQGRKIVNDLAKAYTAGKGL